MREPQMEDTREDRRMKVEDDLELGGDLLKISQRHNNIENIEADIRSRGSDGGPHNNSLEADSVLGSDRRPPTVRSLSDGRHSSWGRSGSWEIAPEIHDTNSNAAESRGYGAP